MSWLKLEIILVLSHRCIVRLCISTNLHLQPWKKISGWKILSNDSVDYDNWLIANLLWNGLRKGLYHQTRLSWKIMNVYFLEHVHAFFGIFWSIMNESIKNLRLILNQFICMYLFDHKPLCRYKLLYCGFDLNYAVTTFFSDFSRDYLDNRRNFFIDIEIWHPVKWCTGSLNKHIMKYLPFLVASFIDLIANCSCLWICRIWRSRP